jgi:mRNA interferase MazF
MSATAKWLPTKSAKPKLWNGVTLLPETWLMQRGEVWWVEFDPAVGSEVRKTRPAIIVSNDAANRNLSRVVVVPLTSNTGKLYPGEAVVTAGGQSSKAMSDQIMAADKSRLKSQLGTLSKTDMLAVEDAIKLHLALPR